jgi:lysosomal acid lipase/cholesteryl ester hydrolase
MHFFATSNENMIDYNSLRVYFGHWPAGTSFKSGSHLNQMIKAKKFQEYDYGKLTNIKKYGTCIPPEIDISLINQSEVPIALIEGMDDKLISYIDSRWIVEKLKPSIVDY